jgi:hypothetical protein
MSMDEAVAFVNRANPDAITSHEGCGAAAMAAKEKGLDPAEYAVAWAKELAEKTGKPYAGHISAAEMARPAAFHNARVTYYDGTGTFNASQHPELPAGFHVSRRYDKAEYAKTEAAVSFSIATGAHGFGDLITDESPMYLVAVGEEGDGEFSTAALTKELEAVAAHVGSRAKVIGFTRPKAAMAEAAE